MKIAYISPYNAKDIKYWSGLGYYIAKSLENQSFSIEYLGPLKKNYLLIIPAIFKYYFYSLLFKKRYFRHLEPFLLKYYAHQVSKKLQNSDADIIFSPSEQSTAYLESDKPIVFWTDATFAGLLDFYPLYCNLCKETIVNGEKIQRAALERCRLAIFSSEWAAKTAIENYQINPDKIKVVPFGANIECNRTVDDIRRIIESRSTKMCKLLFIGLDWARKGGEIALNIAKELNRIGLNTELTVVGCRPLLKEPLPSFVRQKGFISKRTKEGRAMFDNLLAESHFLVLLSQAEAYGVVLCEANSFGLPCITTNVGGMPTIIKDGLNGKLFSKDAEIKEYCGYISNLWFNRDRYKELVLSSFNEYQSRLNWRVAGQAVKKLFVDIIKQEE
jgi:glycosyltransferase involved in cell wall biosynthesis